MLTHGLLVRRVVLAERVQAIRRDVASNPRDSQGVADAGALAPNVLELRRRHRRQRARDDVARHQSVTGPMSKPIATTSSTGRFASRACVRQLSASGASSSQNECAPSLVMWLRIHCTLP